MDMNCDTLQAQLGMFLRDQPRGVTADLTDFAVAYWDGDQVTGAYLRDNGIDVIRVTWEMMDSPLPLVARIVRAIERRSQGS